MWKKKDIQSFWGTLFVEKKKTLVRGREGKNPPNT